MGVRLEHGDCLEVMPRLRNAGVRVDAVVTDPPYHLTSIVKRFGASTAAPAQFGTDGAFVRSSRGFMGKEWDGGDVAFRVETWRAVLDLMKPGAHLLAFSATRTYHRMACAIEDAGFEIRDQIGWLYGSGFPKSHNQHGDWEGWGTALKPAWEPLVLARKPLAGSVAANLGKHGTGALNIDGCRIGWPDGAPPEVGTPGWGWPNKKLSAVPGQEAETVERSGPCQLGRWPANVIHDGSDEVLESFSRFGDGKGAAAPVKGTEASATVKNAYGERGRVPGAFHGDHGSAARFFYSSKADAGDRLGSKHPTVKPVDLMAYLCRLITPPGGTVLDPFAGSGTTGMACLREGFDAILIEREPEYVADINRRLEHVRGGDTPLFGGAAVDLRGGGGDWCTAASRPTNRPDGAEAMSAGE